MKTPENAPDNNVGRKTPEEIKKGLECRIRGTNERCDYCCDKCDVYVPGYNLENCYSDALAYIQQLESRLAQAERERDAAVADLSNGCAYCKYVGLEFEDSPCDDCFQKDGKYPWSPMKRTKFEWRGVCPENTKEDAE